MIASLELINFKRFQSLDISGFSKVNLLTGKNNCGKTGLLEAILLACTQLPVQDIATVFRRTDGLAQGRPFSHWFGFGGKQDFIVNAKTDSGLDFFRYCRSDKSTGAALQSATANAGSLNFIAIPSWPQAEVDAEAMEFDRMILRKQEKVFEARLRSVEPKLESVRALQPESKRVLFADVGLPEMIPLSLLGQGVLRLTSIFIRALGAKADILLIDEIENGLHHGALLELWKGLKELSDKEGTQIFATTHSMECIAAASQVFGAGPDAGLSFHRIEDDAKGVPKAISINAERLASMLEIGFEIR